MMRSLYSAVSGLKTHQTKMDVIGNNVSNVNTVAFKSSSTTFSEMLYQNISGASGANPATGRGGVNAKQIGLGVAVGSTKMKITTAGAAETTGDPFDIRLTDTSTTNFFIVNTGTQNLFTRAGSFYVDGAGNLCMTSTGYTVMGWQVDPATGDIKKDAVSALKIMEEKNLTSQPEATTNGRATGVMDKNDSNVTSDDGYTMILNFYDALGYKYTAKFAVKVTNPDQQEYSVELSDILDSNNKSVLTDYINGGGKLTDVFGQNTTASKTYTSSDPNLVYNNGTFEYKYTNYVAAGSVINAQESTATMVQLQPGDTGYDASNPYLYRVQYTWHTEDQAIANMEHAGEAGWVEQQQVVDKIVDLTSIMGVSADKIAQNVQGSTGAFSTDANGNVQYVYTEPAVNYTLKYNPDDGTFVYVGQQGSDSVTLNLANTLGEHFSDISVDFSQSKAADNGGKSSLGLDAGAIDKSTGIGKALGAMTGISINNDGRIYGSYDNGNTVLLGQIAVAQFANASGLEKVGDNCYDTTLNSGEFDGVGVEISADGSSMTTGELEMSNVDLSTEFTQMIITQRGFQSNSRVITTSDSLLEELINLKR